MRKHTQRKLREIASYYEGIDDSGISVLCKRLEEDRQKDKKVNKKLKNIEKVLNVET